jgi:RNA polymerase sigma-70 factor (ECF subfamily)
MDKRVDTEGDLLGRVAARDKHAFEGFYRLYFPRLTRFLHRMMRSPSLIEEIVNDTMLVVWQKAATFDGSCKISTWVFAIAYRKACKALHGFEEPLESLADAREGEASWQPEWQFEQQSLSEAVDAALAALPLEQRAVFQLTFYHDMGYAEIADIMECPVNTVKTRLFHARRRLGLLLGRQLEYRP